MTRIAADQDPRTERDALLRLVAASGRTRPRRALLEAHGSAAAAVAAGAGAWRGAELQAPQVSALRSPDAGLLRNAAAWLEHPGHHVIGWHQPDYPPLLREIPSPPLALFVDGDPALLWRPAVAIVGSRAATTPGRDQAGRFARAFAQAGLAVVSGMATGIDAAAHRAVIAAEGRTLAVLGCGPDVAYPASHGGLRDQLAGCGAIVSEHLPGTQPQREFFPSRNRILAGLALGTVVIEAGARSGALITARQAAEAGREVFALPGSVLNPLSRGCHRLIRDGAALVEAPEEVIEVLAPRVLVQAQALKQLLGGPIHDVADPVSRPDSPAEPEYNKLWKALGFDPTPMDELALRSGLTAAELSSILLVMELEGRVVVEHGRVSRR